jgi:predicted glycogen debranching enzyme
MAERVITWHEIKPGEEEPFTSREWLVTNGIGGYASGTLSGVMTRRYHGLLIAAMPVPLGRIVMLSQLSEQARLPNGNLIRLFDAERLDVPPHFSSVRHMVEFRLRDGLPVWRYRVGHFTLEKEILLPYRQNTVQVRYRIIEGEGALRLKLLPSMNFRRHDEPVGTPLSRPFSINAFEGRYEFSQLKDMPSLRTFMHGARSAFTIEERVIPEIVYSQEECRGYECLGDLWSPGYFRVDIEKGMDATLVASTEDWEVLLAMDPDEAFAAEKERKERLISIAPIDAHEGFGAELVLAADQFIVTPVGRTEDAARARAAGDDIRTVIAGYHWFTDWGRDTMISLEGLTLATGRRAEAGYILRTFAHYIRDGLIPNLFPEGGREGLYHTADATMWLFHALDRYLEVTNDYMTLKVVLPGLVEIIDRHEAGTRFGIGMDPSDGLLRQGASGFQLTWMDAKVGEWVVTPRRGKAVEINALWYNALKLMHRWVGTAMSEKEAEKYGTLVEKAGRSFNERFWNEKAGHLYDVVDGEQGDDAALRPNQLFSISLPNPVLDPAKWPKVVDAVREKLLTPLGLRTLSPEHKEYKMRYAGDLRSRDAAYHQGTVWAWLMGPFIDAWLKLHPDDYAGARGFLSGFETHLNEGCVGSISEVFDAESPFNAGGCVAQAWSVAEVLRCWLKTTPGG